MPLNRKGSLMTFANTAGATPAGTTEFTGHCLCGAIRFRGTYDAGHDS